MKSEFSLQRNAGQSKKTIIRSFKCQCGGRVPRSYGGVVDLSRSISSGICGYLDMCYG
jgi:hypothetical protein